MDSVKVQVPASTANLGPGFDCFGLSLALYNNFTVTKSKTFNIAFKGHCADSELPKDKSNLFYQAFEEYYLTFLIIKTS